MFQMYIKSISFYFGFIADILVSNCKSLIINPANQQMLGYYTKYLFDSILA